MKCGSWTLQGGPLLLTGHHGVRRSVQGGHHAQCARAKRRRQSARVRGKRGEFEVARGLAGRRSFAHGGCP